MLFDTHAHLEDEKFASDLQQVIERMQQNGVTRCVLVADGKKPPELSRALAERYDWMYWAIGVHPHDAAAYTPERAARLREYLQLPRLVALGEIGLDYHYDTEPRPVQRAAFDAQMELAFELNKPVILHIREAHGDATEMMMRRVRCGRMPRGVMHCYTGSWESAKKYLEMGLYISFSGAVTFKNAPKVWEVARNMPLDRLLVETDCPYMAPVPMRGRRNEPAFVRYTADRIAELREIAPEEVYAAAMENGKRLFEIQ
jgi:TatD DNase family protein